jgi:UDP-N-acetylmuramate dehydrogenase
MMAARTVDERTMLRHDESMVPHTSWRVGGRADVYCEPRDIDELRAMLAEIPTSMPLLWIGYGSNLLVRDGGIRGAVIATGRMQRELTRVSETHVRAGAGVACARLAKQCEEWQLGPAAFMVGIPGTIGGALAMNAGAFGGETWSHVEAVETIDREGVVRERPRSDYKIGYRSVQGPEGEWFVAARFAYEAWSQNEKDAPAIRSLLARRAATQPIGQASCGSVFRNPPDAYAGELIESCGLKGARIGGAVVSEKHANFIVNDGSATAADIEALIEHVRERVREETGVELLSEVRIVGERDARQS